MRVHAEAGIGEFGHVGAADDVEARCAQTRHNAAVAGGRCGAVQNARSGTGDLAGDIEQVLDRQGHPGKRRQRGPGGAHGVHPVGLGAGGIAVHGDEGAPAILAVDGLETGFQMLAGGGFAGGKIAGDL